jgi:hypothetical protein
MSGKVLITVTVKVPAASKNDARRIGDMLQSRIDSALHRCAELGIPVEAYKVEEDLEPL